MQKIKKMNIVYFKITGSYKHYTASRPRHYRVCSGYRIKERYDNSVAFFARGFPVFMKTVPPAAPGHKEECVDHARVTRWIDAYNPKTVVPGNKSPVYLFTNHILPLGNLPCLTSKGLLRLFFRATGTTHTGKSHAYKLNANF